MSATLDRYKEEIANLKVRAANARSRAKEASAEALDTAATAVAGFGYGAWERSRTRANQTTQIMGVSGDLVIGLGCLVGAEFTDGDASRVLRSVGRGVAAIAGYKRGLQG